MVVLYYGVFLLFHFTLRTSELTTILSLSTWSLHPSLSRIMRRRSPFWPFVEPFPKYVSPYCSYAPRLKTRPLCQAWGIAIAGTILQNDLRRRLPESVTSSYSSRTSLVYKVISTISSMSEPTKGEVRQAFLESMRTVWIVMAALAGVGFLTFFGTKDLPLHTKTDKKWDMQQTKDKTAKNNVSRSSFGHFGSGSSFRNSINAHVTDRTRGRRESVRIEPPSPALRFCYQCW